MQERINILLTAEQLAFQSSLGRWLASQRLSIADIPVDVAHTIKGHTELHHRRQDMALRGNVQNDSAMMGEKSLGKDNRVQARTQRGSDKNPNLLAEQTAYQRHLRSGGVLERMFPVDAPEVEDAGAEKTLEGGSSGGLIESADVLATRKTMRASKQVRLRKRDSTDAVVAVNELYGVSVEQFEILLGQRADGSEAGKSNRSWFTVWELSVQSKFARGFLGFRPHSEGSTAKKWSVCLALSKLLEQAQNSTALHCTITLSP